MTARVVLCVNTAFTSTYQDALLSDETRGLLVNELGEHNLVFKYVDGSSCGGELLVGILEAPERHFTSLPAGSQVVAVFVQAPPLNPSALLRLRRTVPKYFGSNQVLAAVTGADLPPDPELGTITEQAS